MISSNSTPRLRHKVVDVTSVEHARAVIRGMRSTSHAKQNYQRSACRDDQIMNNIEEFDHLVVRKAFEVQESNRMENLINTIPIPIPKILDENENEKTKKSNVSQMTQMSQFDRDDMSSDEEDFDRKLQCGIDQEFNLPPDNESAVYMEGGKARYVPPQSTNSFDTKQNKKPQKQTIRQYDDNSSDDEFVKKLAEDDDDMEELLRGFTGPKRSTLGTTSRSKKDINYTNSAMDEINSSDEESESLLLGVNHRMSRSAGNDLPTKTIKSKISNSSSSSSSSSSAGTTKVRQTQSAYEARELSLPSDVLKKSQTFTSSTNMMSNKSVTSHQPEKSIPKHHVMVKPGQRIRVRPSRKQKTQIEGTFDI